jgi:hypothetical protein
MMLQNCCSITWNSAKRLQSSQATHAVNFEHPDLLLQSRIFPMKEFEDWEATPNKNVASLEDVHPWRIRRLSHGYWAMEHIGTARLCTCTEYVQHSVQW